MAQIFDSGHNSSEITLGWSFMRWPPSLLNLLISILDNASAFPFCFFPTWHAVILTLCTIPSITISLSKSMQFLHFADELLSMYTTASLSQCNDTLLFLKCLIQLITATTTANSSRYSILLSAIDINLLSHGP